MMKPALGMCILSTSLLLAVSLQFTVLPSAALAQDTQDTANIANQLTYQRGVDAVIWAMPMVSMAEFRESAFKAYGIRYNDILLFSKPAEPQQELLTANNNVPYMGAFLNLKQGPVVFNVPPATSKALLFGSAVDGWEAPITDIGPSGADKGKGGKYLFVGPGYTAAIPSGYIVIHSHEYTVNIGLRPVPTAEGTPAEAHTYAERLSIYPLSQAAHPPKNRFVDGSARPWPSLPVYDMSYFRTIARFVNEEPIRPRDKAMMGELASIGIVPGKAFAPSAATTTALTKAVADGYNVMQDMFKRSFVPWWPKSQWGVPDFTAPYVNVFTYETATTLFLDQRGTAFFWAEFYPQHLGGSTFYLLELNDSDGNQLNGAQTYKLHVAPGVPARDFWGVIVYGMQSKAFLFSQSKRVGLGSQDLSKMKHNADGSVDIYFAPSAPAGMESNWIPTGKDFFLIFRLYGPGKPLFAKTWRLPDVQKV
jgi:hypothetical protein